MFYSGLIFEYRQDGRLLGVVTGVERNECIYLQHVMVWPGAPAGALRRLLAEAERLAWERNPRAIVLDVEDASPRARALRRLAEWRGFYAVRSEGGATWFIKNKEAV